MLLDSYNHQVPPLAHPLTSFTKCWCYGQSWGGYACSQRGETCTDFDERTRAVNSECCDEPMEDCSSGRPSVCNVGCEAAYAK